MEQEKAIISSTRNALLNIAVHKEIHRDIMDTYVKKWFASTV